MRVQQPGRDAEAEVRGVRGEDLRAPGGTEISSEKGKGTVDLAKLLHNSGTHAPRLRACGALKSINLGEERQALPTNQTSPRQVPNEDLHELPTERATT